MITVLHITPHLGGGVGKALSSLSLQAVRSGSPFRHVIVCLERPEKRQFIDKILEAGVEVIVAPAVPVIDETIAAADIVQVEWWNHPAMMQCLCSLSRQPMRLVVWCHVSGLYNPVIPPGLMEISNRFLFTSRCSFDAREVLGVSARLGERLGVVSSGSGFPQPPEHVITGSGPLSVGYLGSLNFAKLHPNYVGFLSAVRLSGFNVKMIGDTLNRAVLEKQIESAGRTGMLEFRGYAADVASELRAINVLAYLLNPCHYGTAENALLEAMAMGIVPVVLDNAAERLIVEHHRTGLVIRSPDEFADAIDWLQRFPGKRQEMGARAAEMVRERFTPESMESSFRAHYAGVMSEPKRPASFPEVFGTEPDEWFLSCQSETAGFGKDGTVRFPARNLPSCDRLESRKGSVFHFAEYFPDCARLRAWATDLVGPR